MISLSPLHHLKQKPRLFSWLKTTLWFFLGAVIGIFFFSSFVYIYYKQTYKDKVYPGVIINNVEFGGKTKEDVRRFFASKNETIRRKNIQFTTDILVATVSAKQLNMGYDEDLLASQAYSIARSGNFFSDIYLSFQSYLHGVKLTPAYHYSDSELQKTTTKFQTAINVAPIDARFTYVNGKVTEFKTAKDGKKVDMTKLIAYIQNRSIPDILQSQNGLFIINVPVKTIKPDVTNSQANSMGITERIGIGTSLFHGSIENRIYNIQLAATRLNGILIKPDEVFSFDKAVGDISSLTGYKQAYVIQNGRTVLGDGGGICQVSTTFFRAILNAGMPIVERHPHAYRVHYYEEDTPPGIDAAIYTPSVDLKFKNETGHYILVQSYVDSENQQLTFELYGTSDGRVAHISTPVILSQTPAPEPLYQDDPTLPQGQIKQVDFAAAGANVYFNYSVTKNGKEIISDKFTSNYQPWQAIFLRGTKV
ncbi:hypothetical protein BH09PAT1_BH09PAT1_7940 [soil metagenome]